VYEDAQQIELAGTITEGMCNNSITIPKQMIVKRKAITLENKKVSKVSKPVRAKQRQSDLPDVQDEVQSL